MLHKNLGPVLTLLLLSTVTTGAFASNGYSLNGWGAASRGLSGAGVALSQDAMGAAANPASIAALKGNQWQVGSTMLYAKPGFRAGELPPGGAPAGSFAFAPGSYHGKPRFDSIQLGKVFFVPNAAISWQLDDKSSFGIVVYGNGGLNATFRSFDNSAQCPSSTPQSGLLCYGNTSSDIAQVFFAPTYARQVTPWLRLGVSALGAVQNIQLTGLKIFTPQSRDPKNLSDNGHDYSFGYGAKLGAQVQLSPRLNAGFTYQTRVYMTKFDDYAGLLAEHGDFDVPAYVQVGLAWEATPRLTLVSDFQEIFYNSIKSLGNPSNAPGRYGDNNGPGFGWQDVRSYKVGALYRYSVDWTLRAGYSYADQPIRSRDVSGAFLAASVLTHHFNLGFTRRIDRTNSLEMAFFWGPRNSVSGPNAQFPAQEVTGALQGFAIDIGWKHGF